MCVYMYMCMYLMFICVLETQPHIECGWSHSDLVC